MAPQSETRTSITSKSSILMALSDIHDMVKKLVTQARDQQKKSLLVRLITRSPRFSISIGHLGDQVRNMARASREDAHFVEGIEAQRLARVFESSVVLPLSNFAFLLSPAAMKATKKKERESIAVAAARLARHLEDLSEALRDKLGEPDKAGRPPMAFTRAQYLITRLRQVEKDWAPVEA